MCVASLVEAQLIFKSFFPVVHPLFLSSNSFQKLLPHRTSCPVERQSECFLESGLEWWNCDWAEHLHSWKHPLHSCLCQHPKNTWKTSWGEKNTNRDQAKKILKFELLKKKTTMLKKCKIMVVSSWDSPTVCFYWYFKFLVTLNHYSFTLIRCLLMLMM